MTNKTYRTGILCGTLLCVLSAILGCNSPKGSSSGSATPAPAVTPPTTAGDASTAQATQFLSTLEGMPFNDRLTYINAHQPEATLIAQSQDPAIRKKLSTLMTPPPPPPQKSPVK